MIRRLLLAILYAGADHPPPGFIFVVLLALVAAGLVCWRALLNCVDPFGRPRPACYTFPR